MSKVEVSFEIPKGLVEKVSATAQLTAKSKDEIVAEALQEYLADVEVEDAVKRELFDQYLEGKIGIDTINHFLDREGRKLEHFSEILSNQREDSLNRSTEEW